MLLLKYGHYHSIMGLRWLPAHNSLAMSCGLTAHYIPIVSMHNDKSPPTRMLVWGKPWLRNQMTAWNGLTGSSDYHIMLL